MQASQRLTLHALVVFLVTSAALCSANPEVLFIDLSNNNYITSSRPQTSLDGQGLATALHALLSTTPSFSVSGAVSKQVEDLLMPNVLLRPKAVVSLQIPGLQLGGAVDKQLLSLGPVKAYPFSELAEKVINSISTVVSSGVQHVVMDHRAFASCDDACAEEQLKAVLPVLGANYTPTDSPLRGTLSLPAASDGNKNVRLDLNELPARLLAVELANLLQAAVDAAQTAKDRATATLFEGSLLSLQAVVHKFGKASAEASAATLAVVKAVTAAVERLSLAFDHQVVVQLGSLGEIPLDNLKELMNWRDAHVRRELMDTTSEDAAGSSSLEWQTWAAQVLVLVIIVIGSLGSIYSMLYMKYKKDTLLYARPKAD